MTKEEVILMFVCYLINYWIGFYVGWKRGQKERGRSK